MEFFQVLEQLVSTIGFPIVCVFLMFSQLREERESRTTERKEERESREKESEKWTSAINDLTIVVEKLTTVIENIK